MSFNNFLNSIINCFNNVFPNITKHINTILNNNFLKCCVYISLLLFIISLVTEIIKLIFYVIGINRSNREVISWEEYHDLDNGIFTMRRTSYDPKIRYKRVDKFRVDK